MLNINIMHLADAFIQNDLRCIQRNMHNEIRDLSVSSIMAYCLSYRNVKYNKPN